MNSFVRHFMMTVWTMICISSSIVFMVIFFNRQIPLVIARTIWSPALLWLAGAKLEVTGRENIDKNHPRPLVVVSNHISLLDIPCICLAIPVNLFWTAKSQIKRMPFFGAYMMATGMIFIDRSNKHKAIISINKAIQLIKNGKNVFIFPEGRRSVDGETGNFKKGAFHLAVKSGADVIPVAIMGTDKVWAKKKFRLHPGKIKVAIGTPIPTANYDETSIPELTNTVREHVIALFNDQVTTPQTF